VRDGWLTLNRASSKNKKPYRFPVKGRLAEILEEQRQLMQDAGFVSEHVFFNEDGTEIGYEQLRWRWDLARRETKITHTFHSLRRTAARNMIRAGVPQRVAQELLGMETAEIFERYAIVDETVLEEGAAKLFASPRPEVEPERKVIGLRHDSGKSREGGSQ